MSVAKHIAKNTTYLSVSSIVQKVLAFAFYIYLADQLGEEMLGRYAFALGFAGIFVIMMNFGLVPVLTREGAKAKEKIQEHFEFMLALKIVLAIITLALMFGVFYVLNLSKDMPVYTITLVYMSAVVILLDSFRSVFLAVLRAMQKMQYEAIGQLLYQTTVVVAGTVVLLSGFKAQAMVMVIALASLVYFLYSIYVVIAKAGIKPRFRWYPGKLVPLLKIAAPFALADIFFKLNESIDTVMLEYLAGDRFVAWYTIALKLTVTLTIIPGAFATAFFPAMSRAFTESKELLRTIFEQAVQYLLIISIPIAVGSFMLSAQIISLAFPDFPAATPALQLFMIGLVFLFVNYPIGNLLNAANKQMINTLNMGIALFINIILNVILIPDYTYMGAAIAAVVSTVALVILGIPWAYNIVPFRFGVLGKRLLQASLAAAAMAVPLYYFADRWSLLLLVGLSVVIYSVVLLLVRGISISEIRQLRASLLSKS